MKRKAYLVVVLFLIPIFIASCGLSAKYVAPNVKKPEKIALLPTINQTVDVKGAIVFRNVLYIELTNKKYADIMDNTAVDALLNEKGITDGGQLKTMSDKELCETLKVDGVMYIDLLESNYKTLGISETRKVKANFKLYSLSSGLIWEDERQVDRGKSAISTIFGAILDPVGTAKESIQELGAQLVMKGIKGWLLDHELLPEMKEVISTALYTLPK